MIKTHMSTIRYRTLVSTVPYIYGIRYRKYMLYGTVYMCYTVPYVSDTRYRRVFTVYQSVWLLKLAMSVDLIVALLYIPPYSRLAS